MIHGEKHAEDIDENPEDVEDVVPERTLYKGTRGLVQVRLTIGSKCSRQKGWSQVNRDARKPGRRKQLCNRELLLKYRSNPKIETFATKKATHNRCEGFVVPSQLDSPSQLPASMNHITSFQTLKLATHKNIHSF